MLQVLAIIQAMPYLIMWHRFILGVRRRCTLSPLLEVAVPLMSLAQRRTIPVFNGFYFDLG